MNRSWLLWVVGVVGVGVAASAVIAKDKPAEPVAAPPAAEQPAVPPSTSTAPAQETIAYTFKDETEMEQFAKLWYQRQAVMVRMSVLQAYWNEEQANLAELNNKFSTDYQLDPAKQYSLDDSRRVLLERPAPAAPPAAPGTP